MNKFIIGLLVVLIIIIILSVGYYFFVLHPRTLSASIQRDCFEFGSIAKTKFNSQDDKHGFLYKSDFVFYGPENICIFKSEKIAKNTQIGDIKNLLTNQDLVWYVESQEFVHEGVKLFESSSIGNKKEFIRLEEKYFPKNFEGVLK